MDLDYSTEELAFRDEVRAWLDASIPADLREKVLNYSGLSKEDLVRWHRILADKGWVAPSWPKEWGGTDWSPVQRYIFEEEYALAGAPPIVPFGTTMCASVLLRFGTEAQKQRFLPRIYRCDDFWCQGYSEPGAGSDLASLKTRAERRGDHYLVNGQKIWTTLAQDATHIFVLVRTDKTVKQQAGISFLLADIQSPGVTVRPITDLAGHAEFCEVFFDNVRVPRENLVGRPNEGWTIAKALLGFERLHLGSPKQSQFALAQLRTLGRNGGLMDDPAFRAAYAELALDVADLASLYTRYGDYVKRGEKLPASVSMLKVWATETYQRIGLAMARHAGASAALAGAAPVGESRMHLLAPLFNASAARIYGGSNEVQRNILARTVLELPG